MTTSNSAGPRVRAAALFALGALAVHQIRYVLASTGADEAAAHGHGYLELVAPVLVATTVATIGISLLAALVGRVAAPLDPGHATERAAAYALGLLAVYFVQELSEGLLVGGHGAFAGIVGPGGWLALPLAMAFGAVVALACGWLDRVQYKLAAAARTFPQRAPQTLRHRAGIPRGGLALRPLEFGLARRPPPAIPAG